MSMEQECFAYDAVDIGRTGRLSDFGTQPVYYSHSIMNSWDGGNTLMMTFTPYFYDDHTIEYTLEEVNI